MAFATQYDARDRIFANPGERYETDYIGHFDDRGNEVLEECGKTDVYERIQSSAESVDIHVIMKRYQNGDSDALSVRQGFYADVTEMPRNYAEALNRLADLEMDFMKMPLDVREKFGNSFERFLASTSDDDFFDKLGLNRMDDVGDEKKNMEVDANES